MSKSTTRSSGTCGGRSAGKPASMTSLAIGQTRASAPRSCLGGRNLDDEAVEGFGQLDLAGQARIGAWPDGRLQHARLEIVRRPGAVEPDGVDIDVAGGAGAGAAALGIDPLDAVLDRGLHERQAAAGVDRPGDAAAYEADLHHPRPAALNVARSPHPTVTGDSQVI